MENLSEMIREHKWSLSNHGSKKTNVSPTGSSSVYKSNRKSSVFGQTRRPTYQKTQANTNSQEQNNNRRAERTAKTQDGQHTKGQAPPERSSTEQQERTTTTTQQGTRSTSRSSNHTPVRLKNTEGRQHNQSKILNCGQLPSLFGDTLQ